MFSKIIPLLLISVFVSSAISTPLHASRRSEGMHGSHNSPSKPIKSQAFYTGSNNVSVSPSFNNWGGLSSLNGFDNFYGAGNFGGFHNSQTVIEVNVQVCHTQEIEIIQQRLVVLHEMMKR